MCLPPFTRLHVQPSCATQLHNSAALRPATAHTAAAVMPWLLWPEPRSYTIVIRTRVSAVHAKAQ